MSMRLRSYELSDAETWDAFCSVAQQATFLLSRRFLSYHGSRFQDCSLIIEEDGRWVGILPAALHLADKSCVVSHPGVTYGGIIHQGGLRGERMVEALTLVCQYYQAQGYKKLIYKAVPWFYHTTPAQDDLYGLFRLGAQRTRCDLSSTIDLQRRLRVSERRKRSCKKALRAGVAIHEGNDYLPALWEVVTDNLKRKHQTSPVHTLAEMAMLASRFPDNIRCVVGTLDEKVVAGVLIFATPLVDHAQYIASSETGYEISALDVVFEHCIASACNNGKRWFDYGISTENGGLVLNDGLYRFKSEFGGGGTVHEFFEIELLGGQNVT
jgi:hypothetical protein